MPVETFAYIDSLNASNPPGSDGLAQGDDHIRGIKSAIKATWTGITGPTSITQTTLNSLEAGTHDRFVPTGMVGDFLVVPAGWYECNGQAVSRTGVTAALFALFGTTFGVGNGTTTFNLPNSVDRYKRHRGVYVTGTTPNWTVGQHGHTGSATTALSIAASGTHTHGGVTGGNNVDHTHGGTTGDDSPDHAHGVTDPGHVHDRGALLSAVGSSTVFPHGGSFSAVTSVDNSSAANTSAATTGITVNGASARHQHAFGTGGASVTHTHSIPADGNHSHAGSSATTTVTVDQSPAFENMPNTFVVITCIKA